MLFSQLDFWFFFITSLLLFGSVPLKLRPLILLILSYGFYATWDTRFLALLSFSTLVDFFCGQWVVKNGVRRKWPLILSLTINLGLLGVFKYFNFFTHELLSLFGAEHGELRPFITWGVPVGISFYTFQSISYTLDCYRRKIKPIHSIVNFALYVSFFPQLLAGPIERAHKLLPQFETLNWGSKRQTIRGFFLILIGLFKKVFIADTLTGFIQYMMHSPSLYFIEIFALGILMTFIVYCDFGAYSQIARGIAYFYGIQLVVNFRPFYFSKNPTEFWRCWHISLTNWVRDYAFNPLVKSRLGRRHVLLSSFITMVLIGLWHGASLNWLLWGVAAGFYIVAFRICKKLGKIIEIPYQVSTVISILAMLSMYSVLGNLHLLQEASYQSALLSSSLMVLSLGEVPSMLGHVLLFSSPLLVYDALSWYQKDDYLFEKWHWAVQSFVAGALSSAIIFFNQHGSIPFIYFDF